MMMKEGEAKTKICPMGQAHPDTEIKCAGSRCMAWRYAEPIRQARWVVGAFLIEPPKPTSVPASWEWVNYNEQEDKGGYWQQPIHEAAAETLGFCGMRTTGREYA